MKKLNNEVLATKTNERKCHCIRCNEIIPKGKGHAIIGNGKNNNICYICESCYNLGNLRGYHDGAYNVTTIGTTKSGILENYFIGVEYEMQGSYNDNALNAFRVYLEKCFQRECERDCTVSAELPTNKLYGLNRLSKVCDRIDNDFTEFLQCSNVGLHTHVTTHSIDKIRRFYHSLFVPFCEYIERLPLEKRLQYFGSDFRGYAGQIDFSTSAMNHSNFINVEHAHTLEFRLNRYTNRQNFIAFCKFWRCVSYLLDISLVDIDSRFTNAQNKRNYCSILGNRIIEIFETIVINDKTLVPNSKLLQKP